MAPKCAMGLRWWTSPTLARNVQGNMLMSTDQTSLLQNSCLQMITFRAYASNAFIPPPF